MNKILSKSLTLFLSVIFIAPTLVGCGNQTSEPNNVAPPRETSAPSQEMIGRIERVILDEELQAVLDTAVTFSSSSNARMQNFLSDVRTHYQYSEFFGIDAA